MAAKFLVVKGQSWGTGSTIAAASVVASSQGGKGKRTLVLCWDTDTTTDVHVDQMGRVLFTGTKPIEVK